MPDSDVPDPDVTDPDVTDPDLPEADAPEPETGIVLAPEKALSAPRTDMTVGEMRELPALLARLGERRLILVDTPARGIRSADGERSGRRHRGRARRNK